MSAEDSNLVYYRLYEKKGDVIKAFDLEPGEICISALKSINDFKKAVVVDRKDDAGVQSYTNLTVSNGLVDGSATPTPTDPLKISRSLENCGPGVGTEENPFIVVIHRDMQAGGDGGGGAAAAEQQPDLFAWVEGMSDFSSYRYQRPKLAKTTFKTRIDRKESFGSAYDSYTKQIKSEEEGARIPLKAIVGAPGSGKSFFLDEFGKFAPDDINVFCRDASLVESFQSALSINISYNGYSKLAGDLDREETGIKARIIYTYIKNLLPEKDYSTFFAEFVKTNQSKYPVDRCLAFLAQDFFKSESAVHPKLLFLGVDEVSKSGSETLVLRTIGGLGDNSISVDNTRDLKVLPMVTALSKRFIKSAQSDSNRIIDLIPLPSNLNGAAEIMVEELQLNHESVVKMLCRDVGNHGRMLECIYSLLKPSSGHSEPSSWYSEPSSSHLNVRNAFEDGADLRDAENAVPDILSTVIRECNNYFHFRNSPLNYVNVVRTAILGFRVSVDESPSGCLFTHGQLLSEGTYLGDESSVDKNQMTPVMSPFQIFAWADAFKSSESPWFDIAQTLRRMFHSRTAHTWEDLEHFHQGFEFVRRIYLGNVTIREFYCLDELLQFNALSETPSDMIDLVMDNSNVRVLARASEHWDWTTKFPGTYPGCTSIQLAMANQATCDLGISQKIVGSDHNLWISVQNKWSCMEGQKDSERSAWLRRVAAINARMATALHVYVAARRVPRLRNAETDCPNAIIFDLESLKQLYGPTVAGAHCFQFQTIRSLEGGQPSREMEGAEEDADPSRKLIGQKSKRASEDVSAAHSSVKMQPAAKRLKEEV